MSTCVICSYDAMYILEVKTHTPASVFGPATEIDFHGEYCAKHLADKCKTIISVLTKKKKSTKKSHKKKKKRRNKKRRRN